MLTNLLRPLAAAMLLVSVASGGTRPVPKAVPAYSEPALAPSGSEIAFVSGGDIWSVPSEGGVARLLVSHPANETRPMWSPDGRSLAFVSSRTGNGDIYVLELATGDLRRLTFDDGLDQLAGWSRDGEWVYFSSSSYEISSLQDVYRIRARGGTPMPMASELYVNEFFPAPSPDGDAVAFSARGIAASQWWRNGRSHIDESELWLLRDGAPHKMERLLGRGAKRLWPMWSPDGRALYFMSDESGAENIWSMAVSLPPGGAPARVGKPRRVTQFSSGRVLWPSIAYDGKAIVFERDFNIWTVDPLTGRAAEIPIQLHGAAAGQEVERKRFTDRFEGLTLSPDGKKIAFLVRGEVFAASAKEGGDAARITHTAALESQPAWSQDSRSLVYVSGRNGRSHLFLYDVAEEREQQLTSGDQDESHPVFSPDGKQLAFQRDRSQIVVLDLATRKEKVVARAVLPMRPPFGATRAIAWSPDSQWIAFIGIGERIFRNAYVVNVAEGEPRPVTFLANAFSNSISWSADGSFILLDTSQRMEGGQVARVDLTMRVPRFREDQFRELFRNERQPGTQTSNPEMENPAPAVSSSNGQQPERGAPHAPAAVEAVNRKASPHVAIAFSGIRARLNMLPVGVDVSQQAISPDGKTLAMIASAAGQDNVYTFPLDDNKDSAVAKQITASAGSKSSLQFSPDGKDLYFLEQGRVQVASVDGSRSRQMQLAAEMDVVFAEEQKTAFEQAWRLLKDNFYDAEMHGTRWEEIRASWSPRVHAARTGDELRRLLAMMAGELNASHLGASAPTSASVTTTGRLGVRFEREEFEKHGRLRVEAVVPLSAGAIAGIREGDYLLRAGGQEIAAHTNLHALLEHRIDKRVELEVARDAAGRSRRKLAVKPVNRTTDKGLLYRHWVAENRAYVERVSGGRLGYVHMFDMSEESLRQLYIDLDAENQARRGVVIDVRNNAGGFVNAYALDVFARRGYMGMTYRGLPTAPARTVLGQRALERPTVLVTNQHSLSDAEDFTEGYRTLELGKVVGEPTAGWIIYTSNLTLVDGTVFRVPFIGISAADGSNMERTPRRVDVSVERPLGESLFGRDSQLDAAVATLLLQTADPNIKTAQAGDGAQPAPAASPITDAGVPRR